MSGFLIRSDSTFNGHYIWLENTKKKLYKIKSGTNDEILVQTLVDEAEGVRRDFPFAGVDDAHVRDDELVARHPLGRAPECDVRFCRRARRDARRTVFWSRSNYLRVRHYSLLAVVDHPADGIDFKFCFPLSLVQNTRW
jgi:hypothetical protein